MVLNYWSHAMVLNYWSHAMVLKWINILFEMKRVNILHSVMSVLSGLRCLIRSRGQFLQKGDFFWWWWKGSPFEFRKVTQHYSYNWQMVGTHASMFKCKKVTTQKLGHISKLAMQQISLSAKKFTTANCRVANWLNCNKCNSSKNISIKDN